MGTDNQRAIQKCGRRYSNGKVPSSILLQLYKRPWHVKEHLYCDAMNDGWSLQRSVHMRERSVLHVSSKIGKNWVPVYKQCKLLHPPYYSILLDMFWILQSQWNDTWHDWSVPTRRLRWNCFNPTMHLSSSGMSISFSTDDYDYMICDNITTCIDYSIMYILQYVIALFGWFMMCIIYTYIYIYTWQYRLSTCHETHYVESRWI